MLLSLVEKIVDIGLRYGVFTDEDRELYVFSILIMFEQIFVWASILLLSLIWSSFWETLVFSLFYIPLRMYAGGFHARTFAGCYTLSVGVYIAINLIVQQIVHISLLFGVLVFVSSLIIILKAPVADPNKPMQSGDFALYRKMVAHLLPVELCIYTGFWFWGNYKFILFIGFAFIQLAIMLLMSPLNFKKNEVLQ